MNDCVFCRIVARQIPATVVLEDEHTLAFMDLGQVNPGHVLVAVKAHVENLFGLQTGQAAAVANAALRVSRAIHQAFSPHHVHLVPRYEGDGMALTWPVRNPPREKLEEYAAKVRASLPPG